MSIQCTFICGPLPVLLESGSNTPKQQLITLNIKKIKENNTKHDLTRITYLRTVKR